MWSVCRLYVISVFLGLVGVDLKGVEYPKELRKHRCAKVIEHQFSHLIQSSDWFRDIGNKHGVITYRASTHTIGTWLELNAFDNGNLNLSIHSLSSVRNFVYASHHCRPDVSISRVHYRGNFESTEFSDRYLSRLLKENSTGIIYAWSPSMPFSVQGGRVITEVGKRLGIPVFFVLDPHADPELAQRSVATLGGNTEAMRSLQSIELFQRGVGVHYPAIVLFENHKILGRSLPGVKREDVYIRLIQERLSKLKNVRGTR